jgi:hypothetical protein
MFSIFRKKGTAETTGRAEGEPPEAAAAEPLPERGSGVCATGCAGLVPASPRCSPEPESTMNFSTTSRPRC